MDKRITEAPDGKITYIFLSRKLRLKIDKTGPKLQLNIVDKNYTIHDNIFYSIIKSVLTYSE